MTEHPPAYRLRAFIAGKQLTRGAAAKAMGFSGADVISRICSEERAPTAEQARRIELWTGIPAGEWPPPAKRGRPARKGATP
jgi:plasmid maintenance system antidote protein VapI